MYLRPLNAVRDSQSTACANSPAALKPRSRTGFTFSGCFAAARLRIQESWVLHSQGSIAVHDRRMTNVTPNPSGMFDFLRTANLVPRKGR